MSFLLVMVACKRPDLTEPKPPPSCNFTNTGNINFSELRLDWQDDYEPYDWKQDHPNTIETFEEILNDDNNTFGNNNSRIKLTMDGNGACEGVSTVIYDESDPYAYSFSMLSNTPYTTTLYNGVKISLVIKSAEYGGYICRWEKQYIAGSNTNSLSGHDIARGRWISSSRTSDNGKRMRVYVHTMFNEYIYTI